jgi:hypothetical protein|tara:strand:+ start:183 stop:443 length:261 start_codon:yes stop_codon:yes gene_type:complete
MIFDFFSYFLLATALNSPMPKYDCWDIGTFVEVAEQTTDEDRRNRQWKAWLYLAPNKRKKGLVLKAMAAHKAGITSDQIYRECETI